MRNKVIEQTPAEEIDWTIDWSKRGLGSDTISQSTWSADSPDVALSDPSVTGGTQTSVYVTGGIPGRIYTITNTITTSGGRTLYETVPYVCIAARLL